MVDTASQGPSAREWPETTVAPHPYNPAANKERRDPLARGCCQWAEAHPVHAGGPSPKASEA